MDRDYGVWFAVSTDEEPDCPPNKRRNTEQDQGHAENIHAASATGEGARDGQETGTDGTVDEATETTKVTSRRK